MKILLISFVDSTNLGDQLIVDCMTKDLSKIGDVTSLSYNLKFKDEVIPYKKSSKSMLKSLYLKYLRHLYLLDCLHGWLNKRYVSKLNWDNLEKALVDIDLVVFGGGNAIFGLSPNTATTYKVNKIVDYIKEKSIPILLLSAGVGPFKNQRQISEATDLLKKFQGITVRDEESFSYVKEIANTFKSVDPVFFLKNERNIKQVNNCIGICVMDIRANKATEENYQKYLETMRRLLNNLLSIYPLKKIILFSSEPRDNTAVNDLYQNFKTKTNVSVEEITTIDQLKSLYKKLDFLYGTRMHSMIVAHTQLIPVAGISWQPKVKEFFKIINQPDRVVTLEQFESSIPKLISILEKVEINKEDEIQTIETSIKALHYQYAVNERLLNKILENR